MAKRKRPQNVIAFPASRVVRTVVRQEPPATAPKSDRLEAEVDGLSEMIADRVKKAVRKWQAAEGLPDEITMLVDRITEIAKFPDGLPAVEVARLYECLPPREEATQGLSSAEMRLLEQLDEATKDPNSAMSRALAKRREVSHV